MDHGQTGSERLTASVRNGKMVTRSIAVWLHHCIPTNYWVKRGKVHIGNLCTDVEIEAVNLFAVVGTLDGDSSPADQV